MKRFLPTITAIFAFGIVAFAQTTALEYGKPIERELKPEETHVYTVSLEKGQFFDAAVNQRGIDVMVSVFAPDNSKIAEIDSPNGTEGAEPIAFEVKTGGTYRIEVAALEKGVKPGRYEIKIDEILSADAYA